MKIAKTLLYEVSDVSLAQIYQYCIENNLELIQKNGRFFIELFHIEVEEDVSETTY